MLGLEIFTVISNGEIFVEVSILVKVLIFIKAINKDYWGLIFDFSLVIKSFVISINVFNF